MSRRLSIVCFIALPAGAASWAGVPGTDVAVQVSARVQTAPAKIVLSWPVAPSDRVTYKSHVVYRKDPDDQGWGKPLASLPGTVGVFADGRVRRGVAHEYQVVREAQSRRGSAAAADFRGYGYVCAGIELPPVETRGKIVLLVAARLAEKLKPGIKRLQQDLVGDGWQVLRHDVDGRAKDREVKAVILKDYRADPAQVRAVLLLGHVAVPYSGNIAPDGHPDHQGAWPADMYYGDMTGTWTDATVDNGPARLGSPRNRNRPGDGKWDQDHLPGDGQVALEVGRVDLANLPAFAAAGAHRDEIALLAGYLDKDHGYRHNLPPFDRVGRRVLLPPVYEQRSRPYILALAAASSALLGPGACEVRDWPRAAAQASYLWTFGYNAGSYSQVAGVTDVKQLAAGKVNVVFAVLMGSYSGDWDSTDNVVRGMLASQPMCVASAWGTPWYLHHMAMGKTIGYAVRTTQNNRGLYPNPWATPFSDNALAMVSIALHGDPTLRLMPVSAPSGLTAASFGGAVKLAWKPSPQDVCGYYVYRSASPDGPFARISPELVKEPEFTDAAPPAGGKVYMVRAMRLQTTGGGTFFNLSQGVFSPP